MSATLHELRTELDRYCGHDPEYVEKQLHSVPATDVVDRVRWVTARCAGKRVLSLGCTGALQEAVDAVAKRSYGIDMEPLDREWFVQLDLDDFEAFPRFDVDLIVCGEVLEHLANPGRVLKELHTFDVPIIVTVPNAFSEGGRRSITGGVENVNRDHVAYYSYWTMRELLRRYGFKIVEWHWYNGRPLLAEGLIFMAE